MPRQPRQRWLEVESIGKVTVVTIARAEILGAETVKTLGDRLHRLAEIMGPRLVLNFAQVTRLDSTVLGLLIGLHKKIQAAGGRLALCRINPELYEVFETLKLTQLFAIYDEEQEALQSF